MIRKKSNPIIDMFFFQKNPSLFPDVSSKLIFILRQVVNGSLPIEMSYHGLPSPWLQINILNLLIFTSLDESQLDALAEILHRIFNRCQVCCFMFRRVLIVKCFAAGDRCSIFLEILNRYFIETFRC